MRNPVSTLFFRVHTLMAQHQALAIDPAHIIIDYRMSLPLAIYLISFPTQVELNIARNYILIMNKFDSN